MIEKKIKEFFKLRKKKIILMFLLNSISFFILTSYALLSYSGLYVGLLQMVWNLFLSVPLRLSSLFIGFGFQIPRWVYYILSLIIYWYLLSCTVVWVYDWVEKKNMNLFVKK